MSLNNDLILLWNERKLSLIVFSAIALISITIAFFWPPTYRAQTRLIPPQPGSASASALSSSLGQSSGAVGMATGGLRNPADIYVGMINSRHVADRVINTFDLKSVYDKSTLSETYKEFDKNLDVKSGKDTIIIISVDDRDAQRASDIANGVASELISLTKILAVTESTQRKTYYENEVNKSRNDLSKAEIEFKQIQESTGVIKLDDQGRAAIDALARMRALVSGKQVELASLGGFATPQNPDVMRVQRELTELRSEMGRLEASKPDIGGNSLIPAGKVASLGLEYIRKLREFRYAEMIHDMLVKQYEFARIDVGKDLVTVQILDKASKPDKKYAPSRLLLFLGITISGWLIWLFWLLRGRLYFRYAQKSFSDLRLSATT